MAHDIEEDEMFYTDEAYFDTNDDGMPDYPLHYAAFHNNIVELQRLLRAGGIGVDEQDHHGNTALHIATMRGHHECVEELVDSEANVRLKNRLGWSCLAESVSYGSISTCRLVYSRLRHQLHGELMRKHEAMRRALLEIDDFSMVINWNCTSWMPLVSRFLPSDSCRLYKKGACIRMDSTLVDFSNSKWVRGDLAVIFSTRDGESKLVMLDNKKKAFQPVGYTNLSSSGVDKEVDTMLGEAIFTSMLDTTTAEVNREKSGFIWSQAKTTLVSGYKCSVFEVLGLKVAVRKREEHLTKEALERSKSLYTGLKSGEMEAYLNSSRRSRRLSLGPPETEEVSWTQYVEADPGKHKTLGRKVKLKTIIKPFKASLCMSDEFPMEKRHLLALITILSPLKQFRKLHEFLQNGIPDGFPVRLVVPLLPTITAEVTFSDYANAPHLSDELFEVPSDYKMDKSLYK